jgi:hypothetical protein
MGTIKKGIIGGFSGKVGPVVGSSWKGIAYMRSLPVSVKDARTTRQLRHRAKFALVINLLKPMKEVLHTGWKLYAQRQSPFNAATAYTFANTVSGEYPDFKIEPGKVLISCGSLTLATGTCIRFNNRQVECQWEDNSGKGSAKPTDKTLIAIVNLEKSEAVTITAGARRTDCLQNVAIPAEWSGNEIHAYLGFISENEKEIANSVHVGAVTIA